MIPQDWRRGPDMPVSLGAYIQCVEIDSMVYVGGGYNITNENKYSVMLYNMQSSLLTAMR